MGEALTMLTNLDPTGFVKGSQKLIGAVRSLNNRVAQVGRNTERMASQMANPLKRLLPTILGVGSAYGIISKAVSAFMQQNEELSQRMSSIWTALGNLLGPIITQIIDWVTTAISYFLSFLKLLGVTGKSASELSKSASKSAGELKKTLAGFDELNILNDNSGGGGNGQAGLKDVDPSEWMKKLSELLKNKLWDDAADMIIEKMNNLIATIRDKAYELGQTIGEYVGGALHILARIINEVDWNGIGASIALFLNGLLKAINDIDPKALGAILVGKFTILFRILTGFLENISGKELARTFNGIIIGALESLADAIADADFQKIGNNIREFFQNIDWDGIAHAVFELLKEAWNAAWDLLMGLLGKGTDNESPLVKQFEDIKKAAEDCANSLKDALGPIWTDIIKPLLEWTGKSVIPEILKEIADAFETLSNQLTLFKDLWNGGKKLLFEDAGEGWQDIKNAVNDYGEAMRQTETPLQSFLSWFGIAAPTADDFKQQMEQSAEQIGTAFSGMEEKTEASVTAIKDSVSDLETKVGPSVKSTTERVKEAKEELDSIGDKSTEVDSLAGSFENVSTKAEETSEKVEQASENVNKTAEEWKQMSESVEKTLTEMENNVTKHYDSISTLIKNRMQEIQTTVQTALETMNQQTSTSLNSMAGTIQNILSSIASTASIWGIDLMSNFINGIYSMSGALAGACGYVASIVQSYLGFSEPEKGPLSDFHTYGPDMMELYASGIEKSQSKVISAVSSVASGVSDALTIGNGMGGVQLPVSAAASGSFLPYNVGSQEGMFGESGEDGFISRLSGAIYDAVVAAMSDMQSGSGQRVAVLEVNGREFCRATYYDQQAVAREHGVSLIVNG